MTADLKDFEIVIVDDDAADVELMSEAIRSWRQRPRITSFDNGEEALAYLSSTAHSGTRRLVVLDLNMPGLGGRETLRRIKRDPELKRTPVVVLTTSNSRADVGHCYEDGANCYIVKPLELSQLITVAKRLQDFWVDTVMLPDPE